MDAFRGAWDFLMNPVNYEGSSGIPARLLEHVQISAYAVLAAILVAIPIGVYVGHTRRMEFFAVTVGNLGRALPSFGILAFFFGIDAISSVGEIGFYPTLIALFFLAVPPILTNAYVGVKGVDADTAEAARGMGMTEGEVLRRLELPLSAPLIVGGIRTAAVQVVATATLAAFAGGGGLGRYIADGLALGPGSPTGRAQLIAGATLVAGVAIVIEVALGLLERASAPRLAQSRARRWSLGRLKPEARSAA